VTIPNDTPGLACRSFDGETSAARDFFLISEQVAGQRVIDLSNTPHTRPRRLTNAQVWAAIEKFARTRDPLHLPVEMRPEADGILAYLSAMAERFQVIGAPPWPGPGEEPPHGVPLEQVVRALTGAHADEDSEFTP
jgi:hypothetical protein